MTNFPFQIVGAEWLGAALGLPPPAPLRSRAGNGVTIDVGPAVALPGLINSHDHLEFNCYPPLGNPPYRSFTEWSIDVHRDHRSLVEAVEAIPRPVRLLFGVLKNLLSGVTTV